MPQAEANVVSQNFLVSTSRKEISWCNRFGQGSGLGCSVQGLEARAHRGLGPGPQRLGARARMRFGPARLGKTPVFRHSEKSPGGGLAKGWESAETAAAVVGAWREAGTPPTPPPPFLG